LKTTGPGIPVPVFIPVASKNREKGPENWDTGPGPVPISSYHQLGYQTLTIPTKNKKKSV